MERDRLWNTSLLQGRDMCEDVGCGEWGGTGGPCASGGWGLEMGEKVRVEGGRRCLL